MARYLGTQGTLLVLILLALSSWGLASEEEQSSVPQTIAGLTFKDIKQFEDQKLGLGLKYESENAALTIYMYKAGFREIPSGIESKLLREQFEQAKSEVVSAGMWDRATLMSEGTVSIGSREPKWPAREAVFELAKEKLELRSYLYLTAGRNIFFKVRYTVPKSGGEFRGLNREAVVQEAGDLIIYWMNRSWQ